MFSTPQSNARQKKAPPVRREKLAADVEAECCVLAFLLLGGAWMDGLADDLFSDRRHKLIWRSIATLQARGANIERPAVAAELVESKTLDAAGGLSYLIHLEDDTGIYAGADIAPYLRRLFDAAKRRNLQRHAYRLLNDLESGQTTDELIASGTELYAKLGARDATTNHASPRTASVNLDAVPPTVALLNSLAVFSGRIQFECIRRRGPMIMATFAGGGEAIWRSMTDLTSFARSQAILAEADAGADSDPAAQNDQSRVGARGGADLAACRDRSRHQRGQTP
jgi:hypothetical protein